MFKKLIKIFSCNPRFQMWKDGHKRKSNRPRKIEFLEKRALFAGDAAIAMFSNGTWRIEDQPAAISFGLPGDQPVMGDWNGDGKKTPGVFRNGTWVLDLTGNGFDANDRVLQFGLPGDKAVAGDWNGNGIDTVGVFRNGSWYFDRDGDGYNHAVDGTPIQFGLPGDVPVPGDWNGDDRDTPGVFRDATWVLDITGNGFDAMDRVLQFGLPGAQPVSGDWNGNGKDTPAVLQGNRWFFDLEGDGFTGEVGRPNRLGIGTATSGRGSIGWNPTQPVPNPLTSPPNAGEPVNPSNPSMRPPQMPVTTPLPPKPSAPAKRPKVDVIGIVDGQAMQVSFGTVVVGEVATRTFTVRNLGTATLTLGRLKVPSGFAVLNGLPSRLAPNASATFRIGMNTASAGMRSGMVSFSTNDTENPLFNFSIRGVINRQPLPTAVAAPRVSVVGIADGQTTQVSFGTVTAGDVATRTFTVRNLGNAMLMLGRLKVPPGFTILNGLPSRLAPNTSATFSIGMNTATAGLRSGMVSFKTNDTGTSVYNFPIAGTVNGPVTSRFGTVVSFQTAVGTNGSIVLKTVRNFNAPGNNLRLYADFLSSRGTPFRTDVPIGNTGGLFGNQTMPRIVSLDSGRYVIAWRSTSLTSQNNIHYSIMDAWGSSVGPSDRLANIGYSTNLELRSVVKNPKGFHITWFDSSNNRTIRRDFNIVGTATTGEIRSPGR